MIAPGVEHAHCPVIRALPDDRCPHDRIFNNNWALLSVVSFNVLPPLFWYHSLAGRVVRIFVVQQAFYLIVSQQFFRMHAIRLEISPNSHPFRFRPSTRKHENGVFKKIHSGERFRKPPFSLPKTPFTCGRKAKTEEKTSVFKNIRIRVDGIH